MNLSAVRGKALDAILHRNQEGSYAMGHSKGQPNTWRRDKPAPPVASKPPIHAQFAIRHKSENEWSFSMHEISHTAPESELTCIGHVGPFADVEDAYTAMDGAAALYRHCRKDVPVETFDEDGKSYVFD